MTRHYINGHMNGYSRRKSRTPDVELAQIGVSSRNNSPHQHHHSSRTNGISNGHSTDQAIISLASNCRDLVTLECAGLHHLTDAGFQALSKNCIQLSRMDLDECVLITDSTLSSLSSHCPSLTSLSLSHCELITDDGIKHLGQSSAARDKLTILELDNCPLITDRGLDYLMACKNLKRIELYDCQNVTRSGIRKLRNKLPQIKVHAYFAPSTPPTGGGAVGGARSRYCPCCALL